MNDLRDELIAIPGVADAEVTLVDDAPPIARVWLDGSRDDREVREKVEALLGRDLPQRAVPPERRTGLGKGLETLLPTGESEPIPSQLKPPSESRAASIASVAVVEAGNLVTVEIEDGAGNVFSAEVGPSGSIDDAVLDAVGSLAGSRGDARFETTETRVGGVDVVVVTVVIGGVVRAGACPVEFGRPYALARAARQALDGR